jgi:hypothetical protein
VVGLVVSRELAFLPWQPSSLQPYIYINVKNFKSLLPVVRLAMTLMEKQKFYGGPQLGGVLIVSLMMYAIRPWPYVRIPAQTVNNCGNIENSSWQGQRFTKYVRLLLEAGYHDFNFKESGCGACIAGYYVGCLVHADA